MIRIIQNKLAMQIEREEYLTISRNNSVRIANMAKGSSKILRLGDKIKAGRIVILGFKGEITIKSSAM